MKRMKQILAWAALIIIAGLIIATLLLGVQGSPAAISMLGVTMGVSIVIWVLFWITGLIKNERTEDKQDKNTSQESINEEKYKSCEEDN